jgi:hypothetical protein
MPHEICPIARYSRTALLGLKMCTKNCPWLRDVLDLQTNLQPVQESLRARATGQMSAWYSVEKPEPAIYWRRRHRLPFRPRRNGSKCSA